MGLHCHMGCSLVAASGGFSWWWLLALPRTDFSARGLGSCGSGLRSTGSSVVVPLLTCPTACGMVPDQGWNLCLLHWQVDSLTPSQQGSRWCIVFDSKNYTSPIFGIINHHLSILQITISLIINKKCLFLWAEKIQRLGNEKLNFSLYRRSCFAWEGR